MPRKTKIFLVRVNQNEVLDSEGKGKKITTLRQ